MPSIPLDLLDPEFLPEPLVTEPSVAPPAVADTGTSWEAIAARLEQEVEAAAVLALTGEPDFGSVLALVDSAFEVHEAYLAEAVFTPPMACAKGCHHCCFNPVSLSPVEALHLGAFIEDHFTPDHLDRVRQRLDPVLTVLRGKTRQEMSQQRHLLLCPLVMEGACAGHPARPLVCRGWNSIDPEPCRLSVERREPMMDIENHELPRLLA
ncbi:MAG: hypothetical protein KKB70_01190, partial [Proteobacteria bacterium]|nr:hypothetical protein [Pseudomonadota bacterium]MBU1611598.1 hypothetical protein [Pseudomonadota bacterium]